MEGKSQCVRNAVHLIIKSAFKNGEVAVFRNCTVFMKIGSRDGSASGSSRSSSSSEETCRCPNCGKENPISGVFCVNCGAPLQSDASRQYRQRYYQQNGGYGSGSPFEQGPEGGYQGSPFGQPAWDRDPEAWVALVLQDSPGDSAPMFIPPLPV